MVKIAKNIDPYPSSRRTAEDDLFSISGWIIKHRNPPVIKRRRAFESKVAHKPLAGQ